MSGGGDECLDEVCVYANLMGFLFMKLLSFLRTLFSVIAAMYKCVMRCENSIRIMDLLLLMLLIDL